MPLTDEETQQLEKLLKKREEPAHEVAAPKETQIGVKDGDIKIKGPYEDLIQSLLDLVMKGIHAIDHCRNEKDNGQSALTSSITVSELKWKYIDLLKQHGWPPFPNGPKEKTDATNTVDKDLQKAQQLVKDAQAASAKGDDKTAKEKLDQLKNVMAEIAVNLALLK